MILSFRTDMPWQTVQTQIRLFLIRVYTVCHSVCIIWTHYSMVEPHSSNFRVITTNFLGVRIFRKFSVVSVYTISHSICIFWTHYCTVKPLSFLGQEKQFWGCLNFSDFYGTYSGATSQENLSSGFPTR